MVSSFSVSEPKMAFLDTLDKSFDVAVRNDRYNKISVSFANVTGTVYIKATAFAYVNKLI